MDTGTAVTHIGKYDVLGILGVGGMGVVYRGMDKSVGREVAIKTLTEATPELRQRFLVEARSGILNHQNIVTVYDFGEQDGNPYIVMEYVPGDSLENLLRAGRTFSMIEKLEIIQQVCQALGYAHQKGVIHRDIKPANIMVQPDGNIKIVDFGVARLTDISGHTETGAVIGTFHYISPERLLGKPFDGRADIWSAGVMLYLLLARRLPFAGDDASTLQKVVSEPFDPLSNVLTNYPSGLDHILERALAKSPNDRYETAEEMAADVELVNEVLKRAHVSEALGQVKQLMDREQLTSVRPILVDLQRMNPQNAEVKKLLREVQEKLTRQQKNEKLRQLLGEAEEAVLSQRYTEAIEFYNQAAQLNPSGHGLTEKIQHVRGLKQTADKVALLYEQAREARERGDFESARQLLDEALQLDGRNTNLRNERARVVQEAERAERELARQQFSKAGRDQLFSRQYTEAIKNLRAALEIDPTDGEIQRMFEDAVSRQEEQRRRKIIEQIVNEIQSSIVCEDFDRALTLIRRAQERLPGEAVLLQLKTEAETRQQELNVKKLVEQTSLEVYSLFLTNPQQALVKVRQALDQLPGEPRLISLEQRVLEQLRKANLEELKGQFLKTAQDSIDARQFDQAVQILENASAECGESPDIAFLLGYARDQRRKSQARQAAATAVRDAQALIAKGDLEAAVNLLQPVSKETGDAAVDQLLRQTSASLAEFARRVESIASRIQALSEQDSGQALQFLLSQPQDIQQSARIRELRAWLDAAGERDRRTLEAVQQAIDALQRRDLRGGLGPLESVRKTYGDSPRLASAFSEFQKRRTQIANEQVTAAIAASRQPAIEQDGPGAVAALNTAVDVLEFADPTLQAEWKRLSLEAAKLAKSKKKRPAAAAAPTPAGAPAKAGNSKTLLIAGIAAIVLVAAAAGVYLLRPKAIATPAGVLQLNATPFAEVVSITSDKGVAIPVPTGQSTPLRLDNIPAGIYSVVLKGPDGSTQPAQQCVVSQSAQVCNIALTPLGDTELNEIVKGGK